MWRHRPWTVLASSLVCCGLAVTSVNASESRNTNFLFACDGQNKTVTFTASNLGNNVTRFIQGAEISLFENRSAITNGVELLALQYILLRAQGDPTKQLLTLGSREPGARNQFTGFIQVTTSATGTVNFTIDGACNDGFGQIQGNLTIWFFS
jgi:hypothetical protein